MIRPARMSRPTRLLLQEMLATPRSWRHGYDLSQATDLKSGTLYPLLIRFDELGLLESRWEKSEQNGRPPRHAYRLTPNGMALAREARASAAPSLRPRLAEA